MHIFVPFPNIYSQKITHPDRRQFLGTTNMTQKRSSLNSFRIPPVNCRKWQHSDTQEDRHSDSQRVPVLSERPEDINQRRRHEKDRIPGDMKLKEIPCSREIKLRQFEQHDFRVRFDKIRIKHTVFLKDLRIRSVPLIVTYLKSVHESNLSLLYSNYSSTEKTGAAVFHPRQIPLNKGICRKARQNRRAVRYKKGPARFSGGFDKTGKRHSDATNADNCSAR